MNKETRIYLLFFFLLFAYLIVRAFTVFIVHDEIVSKWSYMIDWNPLPYQGYIDANNQFLNSLLGGLFIRLFQTDHIFVVRLASLLSFPCYFWAVFSFRPYFKKQAAFTFFFVAMLFNPFILEFFALARGYSMAWMFLMWALVMLFRLINYQKVKHFQLLLLFSILSLLANLSLVIPICLVVSYAGLYVLIHMKKSQKIRAVIGLALWIIPFLYLVNYSLELQSIGKLYLGDSNSFYTTIIKNLFDLSFNFEGMPALIVSAVFAALIGFQIVKQILKKKSFFNLNYSFAQLFVFALIGILCLQLILNVNYPENRAAAYLYLLAMPAVAFATDQAKTKIIIWGLTSIILIAFVVQFNFKHTKAYYHEYINFEILEHIPEKVNGIPTACGGRQLAVSKVIYRESDEKGIHFFQTSLSEADTLQDYIMCLEEDRDNLDKYYELVAKSEDSRMLLHKRKEFLDRKMSTEWTHQISTTDEFVNLMPEQASKAAFIRCKGYFKYIDLHHDPTIVYSQSDSSYNKLNYGSFTPLTSVKKSTDGKLYFDITFTYLDLKKADFMSFYIWNKKKLPLKGKVEVSLYNIKY